MANKQNRRNHFEGDHNSTVRLHKKEINKISFCDLAEFSAVSDNHHAPNMLAFSEISLLQKFAIENDKICNDSINYFQNQADNALRSSNQTVSSHFNDMRFSFNTKFQENDNFLKIESKDMKKSKSSFKLEDKEVKKSKELMLGSNIEPEQNNMQLNLNNSDKDVFENIELSMKNSLLLQGIQKKYGKRDKIYNYSNDGRFDNLMGFQKVNMDKVYQTSIFNHEASTNHMGRSKKNDHQHTKDNKSVKDTAKNQNILVQAKQKLQSSKYQDFKEQRKLSPLRESKKRFDFVEITQQKPDGKISASYFSTKMVDKHYFNILFQKLAGDNNQEISSVNCHLEMIMDEFKLAFGTIFRRIRYNSQVLSREQFIQECYKSIHTINSQKFNRLLTSLDPSWKSKQTSPPKVQTIKKQAKQKRQLDHEHSTSPKLYNPKEYLPEFSQSPPKEHKKKLAIPNSSLQVSAKQKCQKCKHEQKDYSSSKYSYKVNYQANQDDHVLRNSKKAVNKQNYPKNIQTYTPVAMKESKQSRQIAYNNYQTFKKTNRSNQNTYQTLQYSPPTQPIENHYENHNKNRQYETTTTQVLINKDQISKFSTVSQKKRNISQQMIYQHKRNLIDLTRLNQKLQQCMRSQLNPQAI